MDMTASFFTNYRKENIKPRNPVGRFLILKPIPYLICVKIQHSFLKYKKI